MNEQQTERVISLLEALLAELQAPRLASERQRAILSVHAPLPVAPAPAPAGPGVRLEVGLDGVPRITGAPP